MGVPKAYAGAVSRLKLDHGIIRHGKPGFVSCESDLG
jgi:hypothetical protein